MHENPLWLPSSCPPGQPPLGHIASLGRYRIVTRVPLGCIFRILSSSASSRPICHKYGEPNQKVKVLLGFSALLICGAFSIDCLKLQALWVFEMPSPNIQYFSDKFRGEPGQKFGGTLRTFCWSKMVIMCCASASNCHTARNHSSKWAARLEPRVWEIIS